MSPEPRIALWPIGICLLIFLFLILTGWSIRKAAIGGSDVTNAQYYSHGLKYNRTLLERDAATALGWRLDTSLKGRRLLFELSDHSGRAVTGAEGEVTLFGTGRQENLSLRETGPGTYVADLPSASGPRLSARLDLKRNGASLSRSLLLNL